MVVYTITMPCIILALHYYVFCICFPNTNPDPKDVMSMIGFVSVVEVVKMKDFISLIEMRDVG